MQTSVRCGFPHFPYYGCHMTPLEQFSAEGTPLAELHGADALREMRDAPPHNPSPEELRKAAEAFLEYLPEAGGEYFENVTDLYEKLAGESLAVRREDPRAVLAFLEGAAPLSLHQEEDAPYPNAAKWKYEEGSRGLENAFLEGRTHLNGAVTVVGFAPEHVREFPLMNEAGEVILPGGRKIDRSNVISLEGEIPKDDVRFVVVRLPAQYVPEHALTEEESEQLAAPASGPRYIFRGVRFGGRKPTLH